MRSKPFTAYPRNVSVALLGNELHFNSSEIFINPRLSRVDMAVIDAYLDKKYKLVASENYNELMKVLGINMDTRKADAARYPEMSLSKDDKYYVLLITSNQRDMASRFISGVEFDCISLDGRKVKSTITIDGNVLIEVQIDENGKPRTIERIFTDSDVTVVCKVDDIECTRVYRIQPEK